MTHVQYWCVASETVYYKYPLTKVLDEGYTYVSNYATIATVDIETLAERTVGSALHIRHVFAEKSNYSWSPLLLYNINHKNGRRKLGESTDFECMLTCFS